MKTEKQDLLHGELLELITLVIKSRNIMHRIKEDKELELWKEQLDSFQFDFTKCRICAKIPDVCRENLYLADN